VEPTAPASSAQNGPGERPHRTLANAMRAMLTGSDLEPKFWPYAFQHYIRLYNMTTHGGHDKSPYEICSGRKPDLRHLRTFGCRVYARPSRASSRFPDKTDPDTRTGVFLGFCQTMRNILYYDLATKVVKDAAMLCLMKA
jgi:hypothetical protein